MAFDRGMDQSATYNAAVKKAMAEQYPSSRQPTPAQELLKKLTPRSQAEELFIFQVANSGLPVPEREVKLVPGRKWRVDFLWRAKKIVFEIEGGTWNGQGRHSRGLGFENDIRKYEALRKLGYQVFRFTTRMVFDGEALVDAQSLLS